LLGNNPIGAAKSPGREETKGGSPKTVNRKTFVTYENQRIWFF
jgi:hypothetical protein